MAAAEVVKKSQILNAKTELAGFAGSLNIRCKRREVKDETQVFCQRNWGSEVTTN